MHFTVSPFNLQVYLVHVGVLFRLDGTTRNVHSNVRGVGSVTTLVTRCNALYNRHHRDSHCMFAVVYVEFEFWHIFCRCANACSAIRLRDQSSLLLYGWYAGENQQIYVCFNEVFAMENIHYGRFHSSSQLKLSCDVCVMS